MSSAVLDMLANSVRGIETQAEIITHGGNIPQKRLRTVVTLNNPKSRTGPAPVDG
jgi:hypothetical protein